MTYLSRLSGSRSVFVLLCLALTAASQGQARSSISGFIFDPDRRPVAQVIVELRSEYSTLGRVRTDGSGRYIFNGLEHGRYTVKVMPLGTGMAETAEDVELSGVGARGQNIPEHLQKDIYLKLRRNANSVPFQNAVIYAQQVPKEAEDLYKEAVGDLDSQRVQAGVDGLEKAVAAFPTYFMALQRLGIMRLSQEKYEEAGIIFTRALAVNERCFDCWYGLAYARFSVRKYPEAATAGEKAVAERPTSTEANLVLGMAYRMTKDYPKAEQALKQANKTAEGLSPDVHWNLALLYAKDMEKYDDAARSLEAFLKLSPDAPNKEDIKKLIKQFKDKARNKTES